MATKAKGRGRRGQGGGSGGGKSPNRTGGPKDIEIGLRLKAARAQVDGGRGMTQADLGRAIELKNINMQWKYESGFMPIPLPKLQKMVDVLQSRGVNITMDWILGRDMPPATNGEPIVTRQSAREEIQKISLIALQAATDGTPESVAAFQRAIIEHAHKLGYGSKSR